MAEETKVNQPEQQDDDFDKLMRAALGGGEIPPAIAELASKADKDLMSISEWFAHPHRECLFRGFAAVIAGMLNQYSWSEIKDILWDFEQQDIILEDAIKNKTPADVVTQQINEFYENQAKFPEDRV